MILYNHPPLPINKIAHIACPAIPGLVSPMLLLSYYSYGGGGDGGGTNWGNNAMLFDDSGPALHY